MLLLFVCYYYAKEGMRGIANATFSVNEEIHTYKDIASIQNNIILHEHLDKVVLISWKILSRNVPRRED